MDKLKYSSIEIKLEKNPEKLSETNNHFIDSIFGNHRNFNGLPVYGFDLFEGVAYPRTGKIIFDSITSARFFKRNNLKTDNDFVSYLSSANQTTIVPWLKSQMLLRTKIHLDSAGFKN